MKTMKITGMIFIAMLILITGCTTKKTEESHKRYFLFATPLRDHLIWLQAKQGFDQACEDYDVHCDWLGPNVIDTDKMEEVIETGILQQADGIITQGVIHKELIALSQKNGIPIILVDSDQPDTQRFAYMGKDFEEQAKLLLQDIEKQYGRDKKLKIGIQVAETKFTIAKQQIEEIKKAFAAHPGGYEIVNISESKSDGVRARREWKRVMEEHQDINVAINFAAESAEPCYETAKEYGLRDTLLIYGADDMPATIDLIRDNKIDGSIVTSFYDYGYQSIRLMIEYLDTKKEPEEKVLRPTLLIVNKENVETYQELLHAK